MGYLFGLMGQIDPKVGAVADPVIGMCLGAGASLVFVYLIANSSRDDIKRIIALALLSGFCWEPVWEMGSQLIQQKQEVATAKQGKKMLEDAIAQINALETIEDEEERAAAIANLAEHVAVGTAKISDIDSRELRSRLTPTINNLSRLLSENGEIPSDTKLAARQALQNVGVDRSFPAVIYRLPDTIPISHPEHEVQLTNITEKGNTSPIVIQVLPSQEELNQLREELKEFKEMIPAAVAPAPAQEK